VLDNKTYNRGEHKDTVKKLKNDDKKHFGLVKAKSPITAVVKCLNGQGIISARIANNDNTT
jgi:hypothetical protein